MINPLGTKEQQLWDALGHQQEWFEMPQKVDDDGSVYMMRTVPGFIFDDSFWEVFQHFPFKICHVAYYGPARSEDLGDTRLQDRGIFELRFAPLRPTRWMIRLVDGLAALGERISLHQRRRP